MIRSLFTVIRNIFSLVIFYILFCDIDNVRKTEDGDGRMVGGEGNGLLRAERGKAYGNIEKTGEIGGRAAGGGKIALDTTTAQMH